MTITDDQHSIFQFLHFDKNLPQRGIAIAKDPKLLKVALGAVADAIGVFALGFALPKKYHKRYMKVWAKCYDWLFQHRLPK